MGFNLARSIHFLNNISNENRSRYEIETKCDFEFTLLENFAASSIEFPMNRLHRAAISLAVKIFENETSTVENEMKMTSRISARACANL